MRQRVEARWWIRFAKDGENASREWSVASQTINHASESPVREERGTVDSGCRRITEKRSVKLCIAKNIGVIVGWPRAMMPTTTSCVLRRTTPMRSITFLP